MNPNRRAQQRWQLPKNAGHSQQPSSKIFANGFTVNKKLIAKVIKA